VPESLASEYRISGRKIKDVIARLDALMMVLKSCKAASCTDPWKVLHPQGDVTNLLSALSTGLDVFYEKQPKVSFSKCELGYIVESEGPQIPFAFGQAAGYGGIFVQEAGGEHRALKYRQDWSFWT